MNQSIALQQVAQRLPHRPAVTSQSGTLTYAEFEDQISRIAGGLRGLFGLSPGAHVALAMENSTEFFLALYGIWRAGLTAVPMNARLHPKEFAYILLNSRSRLCLATPQLAHEIRGNNGEEPGLPPVISTESKDFARLFDGNPITEVTGGVEEDAWLFYTSGTTGRPKGAVLTARNFVFACHSYYADIDPIDETDTIVHAAPLSHGAGLYSLPFFAKGAHNVILAGSFDPVRVFEAIKRYPNVSMFAAPTMVSRLIHSPLAATADTSNLKTITYGGAPMYVSDLKRAIELFGPKLTQIYGQGESPMTITYLPKSMHAETDHPRYEERLASTGMPRSYVEVKVVDEEGEEAALGEVGEVITRSDCVMREYWENPEATAASLRDGWLYTGDLGFIDEEGFLTLKDRSKDMIISGGSNIYPREIEEVLLTHPDILEAAVVSRPHADWGEETIAFIVRQDNANIAEQQLNQLCLDNIARYKRPRGYRFVSSLPKNNYGKILKTELREQLVKEAS